MDRFRIIGPSRVEGSVAASGSKNAALPALAATLLTSEPVTLRRIPDVQDLRTMRSLLGHLGVASDIDDDGWHFRTTDDQPYDAVYDLVKTMRASVLVLGALLARRGRARVSLPGGCAIGVRPIDQHLAGLEALGAQIRLQHGYVLARASRLEGTRFRFDMQTVTGTENLLMAAALARGETVLENCAREPEIVDLARLLNAMGARIEGAGETTIRVIGVEQLGGATHEVIGDRIEGGTYLIAAAMTGGDVTLTDADPRALAPVLELLDLVGAKISIEIDTVRVRGDSLEARDVTTAPHPGFPTDLQAQYVALATRAEGRTRVEETIFENRFQHVAELSRMGADIEINGHVAMVQGPRRLSGATVMATDLRASACLVLAGLVAHGETIVDRIYHLDRGYEAMEVKLQALGARVERISGPPTP